jgi:hypothetical protein
MMAAEAFFKRRFHLLKRVQLVQDLAFTLDQPSIPWIVSSSLMSAALPLQVTQWKVLIQLSFGQTSGSL